MCFLPCSPQTSTWGKLLTLNCPLVWAWMDVRSYTSLRRTGYLSRLQRCLQWRRKQVDGQRACRPLLGGYCLLNGGCGEEFPPLETIKARSKYNRVQINSIGGGEKRSLNNCEERESAPLGHPAVWWSIFVNDAARYGDPRSANRPTSGLSQSFIMANTGIYSVIKVCELECTLNLKASFLLSWCRR